MDNRRTGLAAAVMAGVLGVALLAVGCGKSGGSGKPGGTAGSSASGGGGSGAGSGGGGSGKGGSVSGGGFAGTSCGPDCTAGSGGGGVDPEATKACRDYFSAACDRVRECDVQQYGPCESPIDACPDILFADGSAWTLDAVQACTESWKTHDCAVLATRAGPACSVVPGTRPLGEACVFDTQCQGHLCNGGVGRVFVARCGTCAEPSTLDGTCDEQHVCPAPNSCSEGACTGRGPELDAECIGIVCDPELRCEEGFCTGRLPLDAACTGAQCALGLGCQIDLVAAPAPEPAAGTCKPIPALGSACLPTFGHVGLCADGATCDDRPTGQCVALAPIGQPCGYAKCVAGAYCPMSGYPSVPPHVCHALGNEGDACPHEGTDLGYSSCAGDLYCLCATANCKVGKCAAPQYVGDPCNATSELCSNNLVCIDGTCVDPSDETGVTPAGSPCLRYTTFGRENSSCQTDLECLCPDAACAAPVCGTPRSSGETCDGASLLCRQGLACTQGTCTELGTRGIEAQSCTP